MQSSLHVFYPLLLQTRGRWDACFPEQESTTFSFRTAGLIRQHSADGTICSESEPASERDPVNRFHPYRRQLSDGVMETAGFLHQRSSAFNSLQEVCSPEVCLQSSDVPMTWNSCSSSAQVLRFHSFLLTYFVSVLIDSKKKDDNNFTFL